MMNIKVCRLSVVLALTCGVASFVDVCFAEGVRFNHVFAPSEGFVNRLEKPFRAEVCLNGRWDFQPVDLPKGWKEGKGQPPELTATTAEGWSATKIKIPSPWNVNNFCLRQGEGPDHRDFPSYPDAWRNVKMGWLKRSVTVPADWTDKRVVLHFEAVAGEAVVLVNGRELARNFELFLPFEVDVTDAVKPGETFELMVGVRGQKLFEDRAGMGRRVIPAGSMWGGEIIGIWQDVTLLARPKLQVADVYVRPLVSAGTLALDVTVANTGDKAATAELAADVNEWLNRAGTDVLSAPVPAWEVGAAKLAKTVGAIEVAAKSEKVVTIEIPVAKDALKTWTPTHPNLHLLAVTLSANGAAVDRKIERFGWREWTIKGTDYCLNGEKIQFKSDSWHFMGIPQMTRRYAWAWFTAIKAANGNAVRLHAQVYPSFYHDVADELGLCILDESANWASDGGPKFDCDAFWKNSIVHLERFVRRDRNHASVLGWSVCNENKPVILHVFNRPDLMPLQEKAWADWRDTCRRLDPTRPWISADGEEDGKSLLPITMGHYGDIVHSYKNWFEIGKPWGVGEASMAYYGTPQQVAERVKSERPYESMLGRMEGLATECYEIIAAQRKNNAAYTCVFNLAWYGLKSLPLGKRDLTTAPSLEDGIFFGEYVEGQPGVQPERLGPYSTTLNPGYDPALPMWDAWPMYDAVRAAFAEDAPAWTPWKEAPKATTEGGSEDGRFSCCGGKSASAPGYDTVTFVGPAASKFKGMLDAQGVVFAEAAGEPASTLVFVDASAPLSSEAAAALRAQVAAGADVWVWGLKPETLASLEPVIGKGLTLTPLKRSTFLPQAKPLVAGLKNSDFYFCELQRGDASFFTLGGAWIEDAEVALTACRTDWRGWNKRAEEMKIAQILRTERECTAPLAVLATRHIGAAKVTVSTLADFANSEKGYKALATILKNAGVACRTIVSDPAEAFFLRDGKIAFPSCSRKVLKNIAPRKHTLDFYVFSNRPLDDLLIEPDMPKLMLWMKARGSILKLGDKELKPTRKTDREVEYNELPLQQGWNKLSIVVDGDRNEFEAELRCNKGDFLPTVKASLKPME